MNVETEEYNLIIEKANQLVARALKDKDAKTDAQENYGVQKEAYVMNSPSERKNLTTTYYEFRSTADIINQEDFDT